MAFANIAHRLTILTRGPVSRKSRKLFGPEKPFVKLRPGCSINLGFSYVVKGIKLKITVKFRASVLLYGKPSLCSDWLFLGQDFAVRTSTVSVETVQSVYFCFGAKPANSKFATETAKEKCEYCHSSH